MRERLAAAVLIMVAFAAAALADTPAASGFITTGEGELRGSVTHDDGSPAAGIVVHIVSASGAKQMVKTARDGTYRAELRGRGQKNVFITQRGWIWGTTTAASGDDGVIEIHDAIPPAVLAKPRKNPGWIPPYTDVAMQADRWTRAWLLLHISDRGEVTHVKLLASPGDALDDVAVREGFALQFEPARDRDNRPVRSLALWTFEWPPYWWMRQRQHVLTRLPADVAKVPCRRAEQPDNWHRDCRRPDLEGSVRLPWVAKKRS